MFSPEHAAGGMMKDNDSEIRGKDHAPDEKEMLNRRDFLVGLKKWSRVVIGGALLSGALADPKASAGSWINRRGGGGGWGNGGLIWGNGGSVWGNGGHGWGNSGGHWYNRGGGWGNRGGSWGNQHGGGSWANRHDGGGWANRRGGAGWLNRR